MKPEEPAPAPGIVLAGRFRIDRFVARGGMGEVFEATDLALGERVAIKTIRAQSTRDSRWVEAFRREIQVARKVTNRHVCRVFDLFRHPGADGDLLFLSMEFLEGETLAARIIRDGAMSSAEALPIAEQLAAALDAAHAAGVVHRDFKSANVMLCADASGPRAVVTDFGLAQAIPAPGGAGSAAGVAAGTPAYMAPEQVEGRRVGPEADVYALGVVLFEIVTGEQPFPETSALAVAARKLREPAPSPRRLHPGLPRAWDLAIRRCLEREAADRFPSAGEAVAALAGRAVPISPRARRRRLAFAFAAAAGAGVVALVAITANPWRAATRGPTPARARRSVAISPLRNLSGRAGDQWLSTALSEMLGTEVAAGEKLRVVASKDATADIVVEGAFSRGSEGLRVRWDAIERSTGRSLANASETAHEAELFALVSRVGASLRAELHAGAITSEVARAIEASRPGSPEAARLYALGIDRLHELDAPGARALLSRALESDPAFPLAHAALSEAWQMSGYDARCREEAAKAFDLSRSLSRQDRMLIEARYRQTSREWGKAIALHRQLVRLYPDDSDHALRLAAAQTAAGRGAEALETLARLTRAVPAARDDPRVSLAEAEAADSTSDFARELFAATRAERLGRLHGARLVVAEAQITQAWALLNRGDADRCLALSISARALAAETGDRAAMARAVNRSASARLQKGDLDGALADNVESLALRRSTGDEGGVAGALNNIAIVYWQRGDLARAEANYRQALAIRRRLGDDTNEALVLANLAGVILDRGDLDGARRIYESALETFRRVGNTYSAATMESNLADVLYRMGELSDARAMAQRALTERRSLGSRADVASTLINLGDLSLTAGQPREAEAREREAIRLARETSDKRDEAYALSSLGEALFAQARLAEARRAQGDSEKLRAEIGETTSLWESRLAEAAIDLEEGRAQQTARQASQAADAFHESKQAFPEAAARILAGRAELALGHTSAAREALARARRILADSPVVALRLSAAIAAAELSARDERPAEAAAALSGVASEAARLGFARLALEARLARARIRADRGELAAVAGEARAAGLGLLARRAETAVK